MEDITAYRTHSDYKTFIGFIYDPLRIIENPKGVEKDIEKISTDGYKVHIKIVSRNFLGFGTSISDSRCIVSYNSNGTSCICRQQAKSRRRSAAATADCDHNDG